MTPIIASLAILLLSGGLDAKGPAWVAVESDSVRVISDHADTAKGTLEQVTDVRRMLQKAAGETPSLPLSVFALKDSRTFADVAPPQLKRRDIRPFGFSQTGPSRAFFVLLMARQTPMADDTLRHEYVHVLTAGRAPDAPMWLDEGLSEFWGSVVIENNTLIVGRPPQWHLNQLRKNKWLPLDKVVNQPRGELPANAGHVAQFYAQAWAMVHYLLLGHGIESPAFMPANTSLPSDFESDLRKYVSSGRFREASVAWQAPSPSTAVPVPLSDARALAERANLVLNGQQPQSAVPLARRALQLDANDSLALEVMGTAAFSNRQLDEARRWFTRTLDTGVPSFQANLSLALLSASAADRERYLTAAVAIRPTSDAAWSHLGGVFRRDGRIEAAERWCREVASQVWFAGWLSCGA